MYHIIASEFIKMKRYYVIKAGTIMMLLSVFMSYFYSTANTDEIWDFQYYIRQIIISNSTLFFPMVITLVAIYIISREETDDTLKSILTVPISYKKLVIGKLYLLLFLTIFFSIFNGIISIIANVFLRFPGMGFYQIIRSLGQIILSNILTYIALLPIIAMCAVVGQKLSAFVFLSFVYGYIGTFEGSLVNWFPTKAGMIIAYPNYGIEFGISYNLKYAALSLVISFMIFILIIIIWSENKKQQKKVKRVKPESSDRRKGW